MTLQFAPSWAGTITIASQGFLLSNLIITPAQHGSHRQPNPTSLQHPQELVSNPF